LERDCDVLVCGASFAGLAVARELAGAGARVLVLDRYELGERQTSACAMPTVWLTALELIGSLRQSFDELVVHTPFRSSRWALPWAFSTFDYRELCALLWSQADDGELEFHTATVTGRDRFTVQTDRGALTAPEQPLPAPGLRGVCTQQDHPGEPDEPEVRVMERPARPREMAHDESRHHESREDEADVEETLQKEGQLPGHRQLRPYVVSESSLTWGSKRSEMPPSAFVSSLGITHTLFESPWAIWGRTWRYS